MIAERKSEAKKFFFSVVKKKKWKDMGIHIRTDVGLITKEKHIKKKAN